MRVIQVLCAALILLAWPMGLSAQEASENAAEIPGSSQSGVTDEELLAVQKLTVLFIVTVVLLLLMVVAMVVVSITLRRRLIALEGHQTRAATQLEDLWWRMEGPNPFEDEDREKPKST